MTAAKDHPASPQPPAESGGRVLTVSLHRIRRGRAVAFSSGDAKPEPPPKPRISRAAQMLALAHELQGLVDSGEVPDRATLARQLGLTRARLTQILDLLLLAPDIQEDILVGGSGPATERRLRKLARTPAWPEQRRLFQR